jgi:hypothetical protein
MDALTKLNDQLMGAPAGVLVFLVSIVIGYVLKLMPGFGNQRIPRVVVLSAAVLFVLLSLPAMPTGWKDVVSWLIRHLAAGLVIGFIAWLAHAKGLKRIESRIPFLKDWLEDEPSDGTNPNQDKNQ